MHHKSREVTLQEILDAREQRAMKQQSMLKHNGGCVISFTLNIPGPVKLNPLIQKSFDQGLYQIEEKLQQGGIDIIEKERAVKSTGCEALFCVLKDAGDIKKMMVTIEENHPLGRLFDIDVISTEGCPVSRSTLGYLPRRCFVCGLPAHECSRSGRHELEFLQEQLERTMVKYFKGESRGLNHRVK